MKNLMRLIRIHEHYSDGESPSVERAAEEFNSLIESLAKTNPYHKYTGGLSARCLHCEGKYDPTADPLNVKAHHKDSCLWLRAYELVEICKNAK